MSDEIFLYWGSGSIPCWRVQIVLDEKNIKYGSKLLSFEKQDHKSDEIVKLNPRGQLPTLKIDNTTLNESIGACLYLEEKYKSEGTVLIPEEHKIIVLQRAFEALNLFKACNDNIIYYFWRTPADKVDEHYLGEKKKELNKEIARWETYLSQQSSNFVCANQFTFADIMFFPHLAFAVRMGYPIERYYESLSKRNTIYSNWPPHWKSSPKASYLIDC